jgi:hypothetical protein
MLACPAMSSDNEMVVDVTNTTSAKVKLAMCRMI